MRFWGIFIPEEYIGDIRSVAIHIFTGKKNTHPTLCL